MKQLILASTSKYRQELLQKLSYDFTSIAPNVDESIFKKQKISPQDLSSQLAELKAQDVLGRYPEHLVIGSDQVCSIKDEILSKPETLEKAIEQLTKLQGQTHELHTSVCLISSNSKISFTNTVKLTMYHLTQDEILKYLKKDSPFDCAGSYKIESYGIKLFENIEMSDHTSVIGLPLIQLNRELKKLGY